MDDDIRGGVVEEGRKGREEGRMRKGDDCGRVVSGEGSTRGIKGEFDSDWRDSRDKGPEGDLRCLTETDPWEQVKGVEETC